MGKKISAPITERIALDKFDPTGETYVTIRQSRQEQQETHDNLFAETTRIWNDRTVGGEMQLRQHVSVGEVIRTEAYLTIVDCNIIGPDDLPLFKCGLRADGRQGLLMDTGEFGKAWGQLDSAIVDEIHEKVRKVNPQWGPEGKAG